MVRVRNGMLEPLGVTHIEEKIYLFLLTQPGASPREIVDGTGLAAGKVRAALSRMESKAIVGKGAGRAPRFIPTPPAVTLEGLLHRRLQQIELAKVEAESVMAKLHYTATRTAAELVEVVAGEEAVRQRTMQMALSVENELLVLSRPPYLMSTAEVKRAKLRRGIRCRTIYAQASLAIPGKLDEVLADVAAGEQARVLPDVPLKLSVMDRKIARMFLSTDEPDVETGILVVHAAPMIAALVVLFESLWQRGAPIDTADAPTPTRRDQHPTRAERQLLSLLAVGLKDEAIAQQLGITTRTLRRRMAKLSCELDARSRFQTAVQAARRGWIPASSPRRPSGSKM